MFTHILRRLLAAMPMLLAISIASFLLLHALPATRRPCCWARKPRPKRMAELRKELGLDRPLHVQYFDFMGNVFQGDFGRSFFSGRPVAEELMMRVPATIELAWPP
jgi:peptide/nickel transport system permease protein